jgi:nucleoside-diphosphate-sugar epimerase
MLTNEKSTKGKTMRVLVTGHKGFIGTRLCEKLKSLGHIIVGIDVKEGKDILTAHLPKVDFVFHLAGIGGVRESLEDPTKYWNNNVEGTKRIVEHYQDVRVLVAGSSSQYEPELNPYAASKHIIEYIPHPNILFMRFHTVYSESPRAKMFFEKLLNGTLEYTTSHERDFIHLEDLTDGIIMLMQKELTGNIDIGTGTSVRIRDIMPDLPVKENTIGERQKTQANTYLMDKLGFKPKYTVEKFLKEQGFKK